MAQHYIAHYREREIIFAEGSEGDEFFIVNSGLVGLYKGANGAQRLLHEVRPGQLFGELALINTMPRAATAIALSADTTVIGVDKAHRLLKLLAEQT